MRLTDADALINDIEELIPEYEEAMRDSEEHPEKYPEDYKIRAMNLIAGLIAAKVEVDNAPTIDAEPVVRCKDCRWWDDMYGNGVKGYCHACKYGYYSPTWEISIRRTTDPDFYCGDGERREP